MPGPIPSHRIVSRLQFSSAVRKVSPAQVAKGRQPTGSLISVQLGPKVQENDTVPA